MLLAGEPIGQWFRKRNIWPCFLAYARAADEDDPARMCLAGALGYAAVENRMTVAQYDEELKASELLPIEAIAFLLGIDKVIVQDLESGYMGYDPVTEKNQLGKDAKDALHLEFEKFKLC